VGHRCNADCEFCYYRFKKNKKWKDLERLKKEAERFRYFYRNGFVYFTGGEPTIYPDILKLIKYCNEIGLKPTIITNGFTLVDKKNCIKFKNAGIDCFLISFFGVKKSIDKVTGIKSTYKKQIKVLDNLNALKIPFRFNVTLHKHNIKQIPKIAQIAIDKGAINVDFLVFNPYFEWHKIIDVDFQERYSNMTKKLIKAIKILEDQNIEVNVRYLPICMLKGYEKNVYNFKQLSYDPYEWDYNSWGNYFIINPKEKWYKKEAIRKAVYDGPHVKSEKCKSCSLNSICDGFHKQYMKKFGFGEEEPYYFGEDIKDPKYFIKRQERKEYTYLEPKKTILRYLVEDNSLILDILRGWLKYLRLKLVQKERYGSLK